MNQIPHSPFSILHCFLFLLSFQLAAQEAVFLKNPSFEDAPGYGAVPGGWRNCAFNNESPPDTHPVENGLFQVTQTPSDGDTYLGMVARDIGTVESVGQELLTPLKGGQCYSFSIHLCRSGTLFSSSRVTMKPVNFNQPIVLRLWGGLSPCGKKSLLAVSPLIENLDWKKYTFQFRPDENLNWISFEVYYVKGTTTGYNGNILMDSAAPFLPIDCESKQPLVDPDTLQQPKYNYENYRLLSGPPSKLSHLTFGGYGDSGFRVVDKVADINGLIKDNCSQIGFQSGSSYLTNELGMALKEIAVNVFRHGDLTLKIGIPNTDGSLLSKRKKTLKRIFREIGLPKKIYEIIVFPNSSLVEGGWLCGHQDIWLQVENGRK